MFVVNETHVDTTDEEHESIYHVQAMRPIYGNTFGEVFRNLRAEFGRCIGRLYRDHVDGQSKPHGWIFRSLVREQGQVYRRDVWCELYEVNIATTVRTGR